MLSCRSIEDIGSSCLDGASSRSFLTRTYNHVINPISVYIWYPRHRIAEVPKFKVVRGNKRVQQRPSAAIKDVRPSGVRGTRTWILVFSANQNLSPAIGIDIWNPCNSPTK